MSTAITGTREAVEAVAAIRDKEAGLPSPYSLGKPPVNVCPECEAPLTPPPYRCKACGWDESRGYAKAKRCVARYVDDVRPILDKDAKPTGTYETAITQDMADEIEAAAKKEKGKRTEREKALAAVTATADAEPIDAGPGRRGRA